MNELPQAVDTFCLPADELSEQTEDAEVRTPAAEIFEARQQEDDATADDLEQEEQQQPDSIGLPAVALLVSPAAALQAEEVEMAIPQEPLGNFSYSSTPQSF